MDLISMTPDPCLWFWGRFLSSYDSGWVQVHSSLWRGSGRQSLPAMPPARRFGWMVAVNARRVAKSFRWKTKPPNGFWVPCCSCTVGTHSHWQNHWMTCTLVQAVEICNKKLIPKMLKNHLSSVPPKKYPLQFWPSLWTQNCFGGLPKWRHRNEVSGFSVWTCHPCFHSQSFCERWSLGLRLKKVGFNKPSISHWHEVVQVFFTQTMCFFFWPLFFQYLFIRFFFPPKLFFFFFPSLVFVQTFSIFAAFWVVVCWDVSWLFQVKFIKRGKNILTAWPPDVASQMAMWNLFLGRWLSNERTVPFEGGGWALWMFGSPFNLAES